MRLVVYVDSYGNMVITKNATICSVPEKSGYEPKVKESDGTIDAATTNEINYRSENQVLVSFFVKYLDQQTKAEQISQFNLVLKKDSNWKIVKLQIRYKRQKI